MCILKAGACHTVLSTPAKGQQCYWPFAFSHHLIVNQKQFFHKKECVCDSSLPNVEVGFGEYVFFL